MPGAQQLSRMSSNTCPFLPINQRPHRILALHSVGPVFIPRRQTWSLVTGWLASPSINCILIQLSIRARQEIGRRKRKLLLCPPVRPSQAYGKPRSDLLSESCCT